MDIVEAAASHLAGHEFAASSEAVLRLAQESRCVAYDCEFVAVAMELDIILVTMDKKIRTEFPSRAKLLTQY